MKHILILLVIFISDYNYGQDLDDITEQDLLQKYHFTDSLAVAEYLYSKCDVEYFFTPNKSYMVLNYHKIIKIYTEEGKAYANFEISTYHQDGNNENVRNIKGITYNLVGKKIEKTKLEKSQIFEEKTSEEFETVKFGMPNVQAGSIIELKYNILTPFIYTIPKFYFQQYIPTRYSEFELMVPSFFGLSPVSSGLANFETSEKTNNTGSYQQRNIVISARELPAVKDDKYVLNENDYRAGIKYELHSIDWPNSGIKYYSKDWESIGKNLWLSDDFGKQLYKSLDEVDYIVSEVEGMSEDEKIKHIYDFVRTEFTWNEEMSRYSENGLKSFVKLKKGSVTDINLLLTNLLIKAGIDAYPFMIKSRFNGLLNPGYPSLTELNYLLVAVLQDEKLLLLDASSKNHPKGLLPLRAINLSGLLIKKDGSHVIDTENPNKYISQTSTSYTIDFDNNCLIGEGGIRINEFAAVKYRLKIENADDDEQSVEESDEDNALDKDDEDSEKIILEDELVVSEIKNLEDIYQPIIYKYDEKKYDCIRFIGPEIYINADFDQGLARNPFIEEIRDYPVFYNHKNDFRRSFILNIPDGYTISELPANSALSLEDNKASFTYEIRRINNQLAISWTFKINSDIILPQEYPNLKKLYDLILNKQNEKIILTKAT